MEELFSYTISGLFIGAAYAIAASGLVLTYTTTRVFNLAHGATSMVMAYIYWQLHVSVGIPTLPAIALVLFVVAPLYGVLLERVVMRGLGEAPVSVSLVATLGVFLMLIGLAIQFWPSDTFRTVPYVFGSSSFTLFGVSVLYHYVLTIVLSAVVAAGLYLLLNRTRIGTAMRASVDNRELLQLFGVSSTRVSRLSWATGSSLAALAGILLASYTGLDYYTLTFLVISAFAAAMLGRLSSMPLTFVGAIVLGLATSYVQNYVHGSAYVQTGLQSSLPTFMLFAILVFVPQVRLRVGQVRGILAANLPTGRQAVIAAVALLAVSFAVLPLLNPTNTLRFGTGAAYALIMLSLVLLTGYGGYVSLAQFTFVGVGAAVVAKAHTSSPLAVVAAVLIAAAIGALVSLPVIRLTGLYLALATLAFGQLMDNLVFQSDFLFGFGGTRQAERVSLPGYDFDSAASYVVLTMIVFVLVALTLLGLRRGAIGRLLIALRDSPAACGTLGLNERWFRVAVFSVSAGIAGLAGALLAGLSPTVSALPFATLQSLPLLLIAVVAGVTSMTGAFVGGMLLMLLPVLQSTSPSLAGLEFLVIGIGAILLARDPNGLVNFFFRGVRGLLARRPLPPGLQRALVGDEPGASRASATDCQVVGHGAA